MLAWWIAEEYFSPWSSPRFFNEAFFREVYARTKKFPNLPLICMPVKMRSYLGKPLFCGPDETPAEFAVRVSTYANEGLEAP